MLFVGREPDDVAGPDLFDWAALSLCASEADGDDEGLTERVGVPCGSGAGLEGDAGALDECRIGGLKERVDTNGSGEPV